MKRARTAFAALALAVPALLFAAPSSSAAECEPKPKCFGVEALDAALSTTQAGAHPDFTFTFDIAKDPESKPNVFGLKDGYASTRDVRIELPPGLIGNPNVLGEPQQCTMLDLSTVLEPEGGCPNGSQVGITTVYAYGLTTAFREPVYMMTSPGGDVVARLAFIAGVYPIFVDAKVRSEGDYGLTLEVLNAPTVARLIKSEATTWGVPADHSHDTERCTVLEVFHGCTKSPLRPPGSRALPFMTNPTRCGVPLKMRVGASSWVEPDRFDFKSASFPQITGCNSLPFGPALTVEPTTHRTSSPTGLDMTIRLPAAVGVNVLEPSQTRDIRIDLPVGLAINLGAADGLAVCSVAEVGFGNREASHCPDAAKLAETEFEVAALPRRMKGAIYLREPEPGHLVRIWVVADDLGAHVKLPGEVELDPVSGELRSVVLDNPQVPLREVKLLFKSGFRAPLVTPPACGEYLTRYEFTPWSGGLPAVGNTPMTISGDCDIGGFSPELTAGSTDPAAGVHSPFAFTLTRQDGEQNLADLGVTLPRGLAATFVGIPRCEGSAAETGQCPSDSRLGKVTVADGAGPNPLWVPQPGKRPTALYLGGPYKGAPLSVVAVVPAQAGPFDLGDQVVRNAIYVDPETAQATVRSDPLPQIVQGIPVTYRTIQAVLDRPGFTLNPTSCARKESEARLVSVAGAVATPASPFAVANCAKLPFKPSISFQLFGGSRRGAHPKLKAVVRMPRGGANIAGTSVALPHSEFLDQGHIRTVCTRVQFVADGCPAESVYGHAVASTPLFDEPLRGDAYLRSSNHPLPDLVLALHGPPSLPIEIDLVGRIDSVNGGIRTTFESIPDAPVSQFVLGMQGGAKGLLQNSTNLCAGVHRATATFTGQNGTSRSSRPEMRVRCRGRKAGR
jgi:hypothetical protein